MQKASAIVVEEINQDLKQVLTKARATCRMVIRKASKAGQYNNVIGAVNALSRLGKLALPSRAVCSPHSFLEPMEAGD